MDWQVPLSDIDYGEEEEAAVIKVLRSKWLTMGAVNKRFENEFAEYLNISHAISVSNGTAALHLACLAAGLGVGDEVILPALTFVATANAVRYTGATPIFADIENPENLNISPDSIEEKITPNTRAIIVVHYGGYACDMPKIQEIAKEHNLVVIEDAAHAIGAELDGRKLGTWGDIGCFSFFSNKNLVTGEGGMVVTNDPIWADQIRTLRSHGMTTVTWDRHKGHAWSYDVTEIGYNYRLDEIRAALGSVQLKKVDKNNQKRRKLTQHYHQAIQQISPMLTIPFIEHPGISSCHILPILLPTSVERENFMDRMKLKGIQTSFHYPPIYDFTAYKEQYGDIKLDLKITQEVGTREVTLPLYPTLSNSQVDYVVQSVNEILHPVQIG